MLYLFPATVQAAAAAKKKKKKSVHTKQENPVYSFMQ